MVLDTGADYSTAKLSQIHSWARHVHNLTVQVPITLADASDGVYSEMHCRIDLRVTFGTGRQWLQVDNLGFLIIPEEIDWPEILLGMNAIRAMRASPADVLSKLPGASKELLSSRPPTVSVEVARAAIEQIERKFGTKWLGGHSAGAGAPSSNSKGAAVKAAIMSRR